MWDRIYRFAVSRLHDAQEGDAWWGDAEAAAPPLWQLTGAEWCAASDWLTAAKVGETPAAKRPKYSSKPSSRGTCSFTDIREITALMRQAWNVLRCSGACRMVIHQRNSHSKVCLQQLHVKEAVRAVQCIQTVPQVQCQLQLETHQAASATASIRAAAQLPTSPDLLHQPLCVLQVMWRKLRQRRPGFKTSLSHPSALRASPCLKNGCLKSRISRWWCRRSFMIRKQQVLWRCVHGAAKCDEMFREPLCYKVSDSD